ncbi:50S ribosomal protein L4 [candidate division KSB1 bacterium RBG_16_48_16]|nr:MAG: 50S ribosomal protein L4 [candidate division KSB1 bacterium RBG_16_48_16]
MRLDVYTKDGELAGRKLTVSKEVFGAEPNEHAVYLAVKAQQTNLRQGNAATKSRSMVSGGGKKPWKQKGRGSARAGTIRSPLWRGGGITHGPQPHDYLMKLPKKVKRLAKISVLSVKAKEENLKVLENFSVEEPKTKEVYKVLKSFNLIDQKTLILVPEYDARLLLASRNIKHLKVSIATDVSAHDLLDCQVLLVMEGAVKKLEGILKS